MVGKPHLLSVTLGWKELGVVNLGVPFGDVLGHRWHPVALSLPADPSSTNISSPCPAFAP